jgi:hypothetical protein
MGFLGGWMGRFNRADVLTGTFVCYLCSAVLVTVGLLSLQPDVVALAEWEDDGAGAAASSNVTQYCMLPVRSIINSNSSSSSNSISTTGASAPSSPWTLLTTGVHDGKASSWPLWVVLFGVALGGVSDLPLQSQVRAAFGLLAISGALGVMTIMLMGSVALFVLLLLLFMQRARGSSLLVVVVAGLLLLGGDGGGVLLRFSRWFCCPLERLRAHARTRHGPSHTQTRRPVATSHATPSFARY